MVHGRPAYTQRQVGGEHGRGAARYLDLAAVLLALLTWLATCLQADIQVGHAELLVGQLGQQLEAAPDSQQVDGSVGDYDHLQGDG